MTTKVLVVNTGNVPVNVTGSSGTLRLEVGERGEVWFYQQHPLTVEEAEAIQPEVPPPPPPIDNNHVAEGCEKFDTSEPTGDAPEVQAEAPTDNGEPDTAPEPYTGDK